MALALQAIGHKTQNAGMLAHAARDRPACHCSGAKFANVMVKGREARSLGAMM